MASYGRQNLFNVNNNDFTTAFLKRYLLVKSQQCSHENTERNLFNVNNKNTYNVVPVSLLLTLNRFYTMLYCFHC